uniref:Bardet-Biedl syndrome 7 n=1 Tax=Timema shepardi TaxID=629360 RepID=A0A7R9FVF0_TIMSH|nr:unnamed protein product [Timema shepardi]
MHDWVAYVPSDVTSFCTGACCSCATSSSPLSPVARRNSSSTRGIFNIHTKRYCLVWTGQNSEDVHYQVLENSFMSGVLFEGNKSVQHDQLYIIITLLHYQLDESEKHLVKSPREHSAGTQIQPSHCQETETKQTGCLFHVLTNADNNEDVSNAVVLDRTVDIDYHESIVRYGITIDDYNRFMLMAWFLSLPEKHHEEAAYNMQLELSRVDYTIVGLTAPQTMKLLPNQGSKLNQKVAVADQDGVLQVFSLKKGEIQLSFKTLPGLGISRLELGGAIGTVQDKIFVSSGNEVRGYTKKGKLFLAFDTNLTEPIKSMNVSGSNLLICGKHAYNQYHDCKDANSYLCGDEINDVISFPYEKTNRLVPVLACEDSSLRVLDRSKVMHTVEIDSSPTVLHLYRNDGGDTGDQVLYGTVDGRVGVLQVGRTGVHNRWLVNNELHRGGILCMDCYDITGDGMMDLLIGRQDGSIEVYSIEDDGEDEDSKETRKFGFTCNESVTSIQGGIFGSSGCDEILATTYTGQADGKGGEVERRSPGSMGVAMGGRLESQQRESRWEVGYSPGNWPLSEPIERGVLMGTEYSGELVTDSLENMDCVAVQAVEMVGGVACIYIPLCRTEIEEIEQKVIKERERYQDATQDKSDGLSAIPYISINDKSQAEDAVYCFPGRHFSSKSTVRTGETFENHTFIDKGSRKWKDASVLFQQHEKRERDKMLMTAWAEMILNKEDASYSLMLEVQSPIDNVLIQSDVPLDLLDVERNSAVVSYSDCDPSSGNYLLATYRCQMNTTRLELKIRTIEGQHGTLRAYITPLVQPKCCQVRMYQIKPLSLHTRSHSYDLMSLAEIHSWVSFCLPEIPEKPTTGEKATFIFVSTFLGTMLQCNYWYVTLCFFFSISFTLMIFINLLPCRKGEAEFRSDNISTISILKDILTKEATKKKIKLELLCAVNDDSIAHTLKLLHPKLEAQLELAKKITLLEALKELEAHEGDSSCLIPEYRDILEKEKLLQAEYKKQPAHLDRLYGMITDMYIDKHKFKGANVKGKVPQLLEVLDKYELNKLLNFFDQS